MLTTQYRVAFSLAPVMFHWWRIVGVG